MTKQVLGAMAISLVVSELSLAHAVLLEARPSANGVVAGPDVTVELRFNSRIDPARSRLMLVFPDQRFQLLPVQTSSTPARLGARATGLIAGEYKLRWQVLASDGHITRGEISFHVK